MRKDKNAIIALRKKGYSYRDIQKTMNIPRSTLSDWLRKEKWSESIKKQLEIKGKEKSTIHIRELNKVYRKNLQKIYRDAVKEAKEELKQFILHPLFVAGLCLYWGEGEKISRHQVRLSNTDAIMIRVFIRFLIFICGVPKQKIRMSVLIYPDLNPDTCVQYWSKKSGIEKNNFNKCIKII